LVFLRLFVFAREGQTDRRTDGQDPYYSLLGRPHKEQENHRHLPTRRLRVNSIDAVLRRRVVEELTQQRAFKTRAMTTMTLAVHTAITHWGVNQR